MVLADNSTVGAASGVSCDELRHRERIGMVGAQLHISCACCRAPRVNCPPILDFAYLLVSWSVAVAYARPGFFALWIKKTQNFK